MAREYPGKDRYKVRTSVLAKESHCLQGMLEDMGDGSFDFRKFHDSAMGEHFYNLYELCLKYDLSMDAEVVDFWKHYDRGLIKELHDSDTDTPWYSYVPRSAFLPENRDRKYPVVIQLNIKPNLVAEAYGHAFVCAEDEVILVIQRDQPNAPMGGLFGAGIPSVAQRVLPFIERALEVLPADPARVYMTGFGGPGFTTVAFVLEHPELLAGVMLNAQLLFMAWDPPTQEQLKQAIALKMPMVDVGGANDFVRPFPLNISYTTGRNSGHNNRDVQKSLVRPNMWYQINDCEGYPYTYEQALEVQHFGDDRKAERMVGVMGTQAATVMMDETPHHFVDVASRDGVVRTRLCSVENSPHWMTGTFARVMWDFIRHFSRDPVTHASVWDGQPMPFYSPLAEIDQLKARRAQGREI